MTEDRRLALGAYLPGFQAEAHAILDAYVAMAGRTPAIIHGFHRWTLGAGFDPDPVEAAYRAGAVMMMSWEPWPGPLGPIVAGERDAYIRRYAAAVADCGAPLLLRFGHEMNLHGIAWSGTPDLYRAAWDRIHGLFAESGAANVQFVWSPYVTGRNASSFVPYYPGDQTVDWVALDGYNWGRRRWLDRWQSFDSVFASSYRVMTELAPNKPVVIAEIGCAERGGDKAAWIRDAFLRSIPERYPQLRAVAWFNQFPPQHADWRIDSSPAVLAAWREVAADPRYALTGEELLALVPRSA
jgi:hypothetical protein